MHIKTVRVQSFKRFSDLAVTDVPEAARLVAMVGPNGTGKSSLFDGFMRWHSRQGRTGFNHDVHYHRKQGATQEDSVEIEFHEPLPDDQGDRLKLLYVRSAYRNGPDESTHWEQQLLRLANETSDPRPRCMFLYQTAYTPILAGEFEAGVDHAEEAIRAAISPIGRIYGYLARAFGLLMSGRAYESLDELERLSGEIETNGLVIVNFVTNDIPLGLNLVHVGHVGRGIRLIEDAMKRYEALGQATAAAFGHLYLGPVFLHMATAKVRPSMDVVRRNLGFLAKTIPFLPRITRNHLERARDEARRIDNPLVEAESLFHLGLLNQSRQRTSEAAACFADARKVAPGCVNA